MQYTSSNYCSRLKVTNDQYIEEIYRERERETKDVRGEENFES